MRGLRVLAIVGAVLTLAPSAFATPYWSPEYIRSLDLRETPEVGPNEFLRWESRSHDYPLEYQRVVEFIVSLQEMDPADPDFGGLREAEHLLNIVQTDNTSELIWTLSRYRQLTGDTQYDDNVAAAWVYVQNNPAYLEEGGSAGSTGYYRVYNCGWAVRAEMKYREVYGDDSHLVYGDSCAMYLVDNNLQYTADPRFQRINSTVLAWAGGNLYAYGVERDNALYREYGALRGRRVKNWSEGEPTLLGCEEWAMSGGAIMWGVLNSYYQEYPESTLIWVSNMGPNMDTYADPGDFQNAWNAWFALGHLAAGEASGEPGYVMTHNALVDTLLFEDGDDDGGIPARPEDTDDMDHAWIANYQAFMGLNPLISTTDVAVAGPAPALNVVLEGNWPNPFNPNTQIGFSMSEPERVSLAVYDVEGRLVRTLMNKVAPAGRNIAVWDGRDNSGQAVSPGVYFYRLSTDRAALSRKMVMIQ
jgi:hypothetical protein